MINESELRRWWDVERRNGLLTEIRLISPEGKIGSGYFKSIDNIISELNRYPGYGVYYTINTPLEECYGRIQCEKFCFRVKSTTQDKEVRGRDEIVIDLDPCRVAGTNSTDEELGFAKKRANDIYKWLLDNGFYPPIVNISANGVHLKLRCAMKNSDENTETVKKFLGVIDMLFSDDKVDVDTSLFNASRILKCCGTVSYKGNDNPNSDRPRRMASYVKIPDDWYENINPNEYFEKVAAMYPEPEQPTRSNNYQHSTFNLDDFIKEHNIGVAKVVTTNKLTKYILQECPFCKSKAPDSALFVLPSGAMSFRCLHNRCQHQDFKAFRLFYDPQSYSRREYAEYVHKQMYYRGVVMRKPFEPKPEIEGKPKWLSMKQIKYIDITQLTSIPTGYEEFDKKAGGLLLGDVTVLSGISGAGKTSILDCIALNAVQRGFKVAIWSAEMQNFRFKSWLEQVCCGRPYVKKKEGYDNLWYCPKSIAEKIDDWLDGKMFLYDCEEYGTRYSQLSNDLQEIVEKENINLVILDNLAAMNLSDLDGQKYEKQTQFITEVKDFCKKKNVACIIVCHPRKVVSFLRKEDVAGTADLINLADNLLILHRVGKDFVQRASEFLEKTEVEKYSQYSSVIEICKNRSYGVVDTLVGLYFEPESRRLKNSVAEHIVYGWADEPQQMSMPIEPINDESADPFAPTDENEVVPF